MSNKSDTDNNRRDLNYLKTAQRVPEQHNGKAGNRGIPETSLIEHCTQTGESANVKVQNTIHDQNNITCKTNCKYSTVATLNNITCNRNCKYSTVATLNNITCNRNCKY
jgi:hypothetical protein